MDAQKAAAEDTRTCTCHPTDRPPVPCPRRFTVEGATEAGRRFVGSDQAWVEIQSCEHCGRGFNLATMTRMSDAWFCAGCTAEWQATFDACGHKWAPYVDEMGDAGHVCEKCSGFVANDTFDALFGKGALAALGE